MSMALRFLGPLPARAIAVFAAAAALAATAWLANPVPDDAVAVGGKLAGQPHERTARPDGFLSASPFDPERRAVDGIGSLSKPAPAQVVEAVPSPLEPAAPLLAGILVDGRDNVAMFDGEWHKVGSPVSGWIIAAIEPERVILRQGKQSLVLRRKDAFRP